jgi:hypothetical protein
MKLVKQSLLCFHHVLPRTGRSGSQSCRSFKTSPHTRATPFLLETLLPQENKVLAWRSDRPGVCAMARASGSPFGSWLPRCDIFSGMKKVYRHPLPLYLFFLPSQPSLFFLFNLVTRSYSFNQQNASHNPPPPGPRQRNSRTKHNVPLRSADRQQQNPFYTQRYFSLSLQRKRKSELTEIRRPPRNTTCSRHSPLQRSGNYDLSTEQRCI